MGFATRSVYGFRDWILRILRILRKVNVEGLEGYAAIIEGGAANR